MVQNESHWRRQTTYKDLIYRFELFTIKEELSKNVSDCSTDWLGFWAVPCEWKTSRYYSASASNEQLVKLFYS